MTDNSKYIVVESMLGECPIIFDSILNHGNTFHPHVSGIYEAGYKSPIDPRNLPAIDLTLPTQTEGQKKEAAGWDQIKIIKDYLDAPKETDPWVILANVRNLV